MVLVVGAAGQGKSTSLASMIGHLNATRALHIVTVEDPIEFMHRDQMSSISQREVGLDTASFAGRPPEPPCVRIRMSSSWARSATRRPWTSR